MDCLGNKTEVFAGVIGNESDKQRNIFQCGRCGKAYQSVVTYVSHMERHGEIIAYNKSRKQQKGV